MIANQLLNDVVLGGFEPPLTEPKTVVLPLHHGTKCGCKGKEFI